MRWCGDASRKWYEITRQWGGNVTRRRPATDDLPIADASPAAPVGAMATTIYERLSPDSNMPDANDVNKQIITRTCLHSGALHTTKHTNNTTR